jgi:hypothetical protein
MKHPPTRIVRAFRRAARLRAAGVGWDRVAEALRRKIETVEEWPDDYPEYWDIVYARQERHARAECRAESRQYLRVHLRAQDAKICQNSARPLVNLTDPPPIPQESKPTSHLHRYADHLGGLSDEERDTLFKEEIAYHARRADPDGPGLAAPGCT